MKVILKRSMENLGESGTVVDVKPGYARNYLLPQGLAYEASEANLRRIEEERKLEEERSRRDYLEARRRASQIEDVSLVFHERASEEGRLFGSVSAVDIAGQLNERGMDFEVERKHVRLEEPLKEVGAYTVTLELHAEVELELDVRVERTED
ncbi:MAG: 50S ribosomal protein L9 [Gemmatimonadales bacterium]|nr:MAG: 50S ribosomal protein L9 [Gemmatimonadales bacterium]